MFPNENSSHVCQSHWNFVSKVKRKMYGTGVLYKLRNNRDKSQVAVWENPITFPFKINKMEIQASNKCTLNI